MPSRVREGPAVAVEALAEAFDNVLAVTGVPREAVRAVGLDTPGPASADGVISTKGSTNFVDPAWRGFDVRGALEARLGLPVVYNNDGNAAALYAHHVHFGLMGPDRSSVSAIVGTGLGGGVIEQGRIVSGAAGMAGELGHVHIPMARAARRGPAGAVVQLRLRRRRGERRLADRHRAQPAAVLADPVPRPRAAAEVADPREAAKLVRGLGEQGDALALKIFEQQAMAIGRLFTIAANFTDPDAYFVGGGVVQASTEFGEWFLSVVREQHQPARGAGAGRRVRAGARPRHGRRPRGRARRPADRAARDIARVPADVAVPHLRPDVRQPPPDAHLRGARRPGTPFRRRRSGGTGGVRPGARRGPRPVRGAAGEDPDRAARPDELRRADATQRHWLDGHLVLARRLESPRFRRVETFSARNVLHAFRLTGPDDVDDAFAGWVAEAYDVGLQRHLAG